MRLAGQAKGGFYPTPPRVADMIADGVRMPPHTQRKGRAGETLRILDPCCGKGEAAGRLADGIREWDDRSVETFGIELHRERAQEARRRMTRVLSVDMFQTQIANRAFGMLFLNPPYHNDPEKGRAEVGFLSHCARHLVPGGLLVLIVPLIRLGACARHLSSHYRRMDVRSFPDPEWEDFNQVVLTGYRREQPSQDQEAEKMVRSWGEARPEPMGAEGMEERTYSPAVTPAGQVLFAGRSIDPEEAAREARRAGLWENPEIGLMFWPPEDQKTLPLLPLREGHMAMLVAAGFLNNMQLDDGEGRIMVKGQTVKKKVLVESNGTEDIFDERMHTTVTALDMDTGEIREIRT